MSATNPSFLLKLTGEENVTTFNNTITWSPAEKLEFDVTLNATTKVLDFSDISNINTMIFSTEGSGDFTLAWVVGGQTITFVVTDTFVINPSTTFMGTVTSITIGNSASTDLTISVGIYGEAT